MTTAAELWQLEASRLERQFESVRAIMNGEANRFARALSDLQRLASVENVPMAIIGGLGAIHFGYPAATQDVDILVSKQDLDRLTQLAPNYGFRVAWHANSGWHTLTHGDVEINIVPEGGRARNSSPTLIPSP